MEKTEEVVGTLDKNLTLQTYGKLKIRYGKKVIDLLDRDGELAIPDKLQSQLDEILKRLTALENN